MTVRVVVEHPRRPRGRSWGAREIGASGNDSGGGGGPTICPWVSEDGCSAAEDDSEIGDGDINPLNDR